MIITYQIVVFFLPKFTNPINPATNLPQKTPHTHNMSAEKVLVLQATGKLGGGVVAGLKAAGYGEIWGTTRSAKGVASLEKKGVKGIVANYVVKADIERAIKESGAKNIIFLTDFFLAAKGSKKREEKHGKRIIDVAKEQGIEFTIFLSVGDVVAFESQPKVHHMHAKMVIEKYLKESGLKHAVIRPVAFYENFDDAANWNPLTKGSVKFLTDAPVWLVSTYDVGKAAAVMLRNQDEWAGKALEAASHKQTVHEVAAALEKVSGVPTKGSLAMPMCARSLFLSDLHHMCLFFENGYQGTAVDADKFKAVVPDALDAEGWFRYHGTYANGEKIAQA